MDFFELNIELEFCSAHIISGHKGKCSNLHGHNYKTRISLAGSELDSLGFLIDFSDLKEISKEVIELLDHKYINEINYPLFLEGKTSAENIAKYIYEQLETRLGRKKSLLNDVTIWETPKYSVRYFKKS